MAGSSLIGGPEQQTMTAAERPSDAAPRKRRWHQFSLRTLLLLTAVLGLCLGVSVRLWRRHQAVDAIRAMPGADVAYDYQYEAERDRFDGSAVPPGPKWLRKLVGDSLFDDMFCNVVGAYVGAYNIKLTMPLPPKDQLTSIDDEDLRRMKEIVPRHPGLLWLGITVSSRVTDAGLAHLEGVTQLRDLDLAESQVTDAGLVHVRHATGLEHLDLRGTKVGKGCVARLAPFSKLRRLSLGGTGVDDSGLKDLNDFASLRELYLFDTKITDTGLNYLHGLPNLEGLSLYGTAITDAGLPHLRGMKALRGLNLSLTKVTDAGLVHLQELPALEFLSLAGTPVLGRGLGQLR